MAFRQLRPFQYSLLSVLLLIAIVAVTIAFGIYFLGLLIAIAIVTSLLRERNWLGAGIVACSMLAMSMLGVGVSTQIRLDTGDQRTTVWGVPLIVFRMPDSARNALLSLRTNQQPIRWCICARNVGSHHPDAMLWRMYQGAAAWVPVNNKVAHLVLHDIADYVESTHGTRGGPECYDLLVSPVLVGVPNNYRIADEWQDSAEVQAYLRKKGLVLMQEHN